MLLAKSIISSNNKQRQWKQCCLDIQKQLATSPPLMVRFEIFVVFTVFGFQKKCQAKHQHDISAFQRDTHTCEACHAVCVGDVSRTNECTNKLGPKKSERPPSISASKNFLLRVDSTLNKRCGLTAWKMAKPITDDTNGTFLHAELPTLVNGTSAYAPELERETIRHNVIIPERKLSRANQQPYARTNRA